MPPKRKCHFLDEYTKQWSFIKKGRTDTEAHCSICGLNISISHGGRSDIIHHNSSNGHKSKMTASTTSMPISSFMIKPDTPEDELVCAAELTTAFKVVNHHQSFSSLDCTTKLSALMYPDSKIAAKQSTARTKATAIIKNILAPHTLYQCKAELESTPFYGILTDASNHKAEKMFPLLIQYFTEDKGMQTKLLKLDCLKNETSDTVTSFCMTSLQTLGIPIEKLVAFGGDNTNTNFGGRERQGVNNVYFKIKSVLGREIEGIGCPAHILHNTASTAADGLSIDADSIVNKIFKYFSIYTVRNEKLKDLCDYIDVSYANVMSHSRTRWLSLMPAIERILKLWEPLKAFFQAEKKPPKAISDFFSNPLAELYFLFIHSQAYLFEQEIKKIEKNIITIVEVKIVLEKIKNSLLDRHKSSFLGMKTKQLYNKLKTDDNIAPLLTAFEKEVKDFYTTATTYLESWSESMSKFEVFEWMTLDVTPTWENVEKTVLHLNSKGFEIHDSIFDEFLYMQSFVEQNIENEDWSEKKMHDKWLNFFHVTKELERKRNLLKICQYLYAVPGHNANVERIFSMVSAQWTNERNSLNIDTVESIMQCKYNFKMTCTEFYKYVKKEKHLIKLVKSSEKYSWHKKDKE